MEDYSTLTDVKEIDKAAKKGLTQKSYERRFLNAIEGNSLPVGENGEFGEEFTFDAWKIINEGKDTAYIKMRAEDKGGCSVSLIQGMAWLGEKDGATFKKVDNPTSPMNGKFVLEGSSVINPHLLGNQAEVIARLMNKQCRAKLVQGYVLPYAEKGYASKTGLNDKLDTKKFYQLEIVG